jgi:branched-chain amino acid transport system substrate-binding protein
MKKHLISFFAAVMALFVSCTGKNDVVKIGVVGPMTGAGAATAEYWMNGLNLAVEQINAREDGTKYELVFEDCRSDAKEAVSCYKRLELQGIRYIIAVGGQFAMAIAPLTKEQDVLYFTTSDYNDAVLNATDCAFRAYPSANTLGKTAAEYLYNELGRKKVATVIINTVPNLLAGKAFVAHFEELGGTIAFSDTYDIGQFDFKDMVAKMSQEDIDCVFYIGFGQSANSFTTQLYANPKFQDVVILGDVNLSTKDYLTSVENIPLDVYVADTKLSEEFEHLYAEKFNSASNSVASCASIIPFIIDEARNNAEDKNDLKAQLNYIRGREFSSPVGAIQFDETGNVQLPMQVYKVK